MMKKIKKILLILSVTTIGLLLALTIGFKLRYGSDTIPFPNRLTPPLLNTKLEVVATLPEAPGNLAVSATGRIFFNFHPEGRPQLKVLELVNGQPMPYPNLAFQQDSGNGKPYFDAVFSLRIDRQNRLWTIDHGFHGLRQPRLLAFDLTTNQLVHQYDFPREIAGIGSYLQDFQVDPSGKWIYIADIGVMAKKPAIIVYNIENKSAVRRLERDNSVMDKPYLIDARGKKMILIPWLYAMHPALDSIALDKTGEWLYYGPMSHEDMFRIKTSDLTNFALNDPELSPRVERFADKVQSDGLSMDMDGNIYITDIEHGAIAILDQNRKLQTLLQDERIRWPDGLSFGPEGWLYIADSDIPDIMLKSRSHIAKSAPFYIFRFQTSKQSVPGH